MNWRSWIPEHVQRSPQPLMEDIAQWIMGFPWVVERPCDLSRSVRMFAVDCEPLQRRRMWLVGGLRGGCGIAVILPAEVANEMEGQGLTRCIAPMPPGHVLTYAREDVDRTQLDAIVLESYSQALR